MLPNHRTKIVCTIGPASDSEETLRRMIRAGMNVVRLNFSHGDFESHAAVISRVRTAAREVGRPVAIMADLPGPKIRIGEIAEEPVELRRDEPFVLTTTECVGGADRASVAFLALTGAARPGHALFLNDGYIELLVEEVVGDEVRCRVVAGGELRSRKGLNLPGIDLGISAFTDRDRECLEFALAQGVDAVSQSFVSGPDDIAAVREAAEKTGHRPFVIAKIERAGALERIDEILDASDGIMVARGDLGVEIPIEEIAIVQKRLVFKAVRLGKPVITATHMLESMVEHRRPTRAEATDVANAILDGTDCVMLSGESAMGRFPVESVEMLAAIAAATEPHRPTDRLRKRLENHDRDDDLDAVDLIALSVFRTVDRVVPAVVLVPTLSGATARNVARFRLPVWIAGVTPREETAAALAFTYGVDPCLSADHPADWKAWARDWLAARNIDGPFAILTEGPSADHPDGNHRMELLDLR